MMSKIRNLDKHFESLNMEDTKRQIRGQKVFLTLSFEEMHGFIIIRKNCMGE